MGSTWFFHDLRAISYSDPITCTSYSSVGARGLPNALAAWGNPRTDGEDRVMLTCESIANLGHTTGAEQ
ncbi:hypothetical protein ACMX2H_03295 [Arthrobacter sulfonylureivorans]|uniref:hypothetical protein n=1 Tax=Arthrobacter sulfonylureivorans TaxID=2486855 RepID=UPI0039E352F5